MNTETMKRIAELLHPNSEVSIHFAESNTIVVKGEDGKIFHFNPLNTKSWIYERSAGQQAEVELKLIRMYREWLYSTVNITTERDRLWMALESTETLLEAISRDML